MDENKEIKNNYNVQLINCFMPTSGVYISVRKPYSPPSSPLKMMFLALHLRLANFYSSCILYIYIYITLLLSILPGGLYSVLLFLYNFPFSYSSLHIFSPNDIDQSNFFCGGYFEYTPLGTNMCVSDSERSASIKGAATG